MVRYYSKQSISMMAFLILFCVTLCSTQSIGNDMSSRIQSAIIQSRKKVELLRIQYQVPGISVGFSYRGEEIWTDGFGFADLETSVPCTSRSLHRIGSISKSVSMLLVGKLWEDGRIDLDKPIYDYLGDAFPRKIFDGNEVNITLRQLVSHMGGIRHYLSLDEAYQKDRCESRFDSLKFFKDDQLVAEPGTEFFYSSYGFVIIAAVLQSVLNENETFEPVMLSMLKNELGMRETYFDEVNEIFLNRGNYYQVNNENEIKIAPFVDSSCRWPGGGMLSNVHDLLRFGNVMIYSSKTDSGFLKKDTVDSFWQKIVPYRNHNLFNIFYGMGWELLERKASNCSSCETVPYSFAAGHSGGSSGATAHLMVVPEEEMVLAILTNVEPLPMIREVAFDIMSTFIEYVNQIEYSSEPSHANTIFDSKMLFIRFNLFIMIILFLRFY